MPFLKISIVGAGFAGLAAGFLLRRSGHQVDIFEKFQDPKPVGAGVLIQPTGLWAMRKLGVEQDTLGAGSKLVTTAALARSNAHCRLPAWRPRACARRRGVPKPEISAALTG